MYKTEPYVIAADVYAEPLHKGRGGWTWYTGSAGWMYQLIINSFIGLKREGDMLHFKPCIPPEWNSLKIKYQFEGKEFDIELVQENEKIKLIVNGETQEGLSVALKANDLIEV